MGQGNVTRFWTETSLELRQLSTLQITFSIPKHNQAPLKAVPAGEEMDISVFGFFRVGEWPDEIRVGQGET